ncbi:MAG: PspC domain-containing protein [Saprospiraceae bacterium]
MNKVIQANLGGIAFTFDDEAYSHLDEYLASLDGYFNKSHGHNEIMHDIEARLAELFSDNLKGRSIVTTEDVSAAVATMGSPEEFGASDEVHEEEAFEQKSFEHQKRSRKGGKQRYSRYGKRLMRDPDNKKLAGVCSGLAAYFGIEDTLVMRIIALVSIPITSGASIIAYFVLWMVTPIARTAGDKLAMRGAAIDVRNISKEVEDEFSNISTRLQEWGDEVSKTDWSNKFGGGGGKRRNQKKDQQEPQDEGYMV